MSLSGEQMTTWSTSGSSAQRATAAAIASSASKATIGQSRIPSASMAASAIGNWAISRGSTPTPVL